MPSVAPTSSAAERESTIRAGRTLDGRFRLVERVGAGAMGSVWRARHLLLDTDVAIKLLRDGLPSQEASRRFEREAQVCARLAGESDHIVRVLDFGLTQVAELGEHWMRPYLVMEFLEGRSLASVLLECKRLRFSELRTLLLQTLRGLEVLHAAGIVHRDIKPDNLFLASVGSTTKLKIVDLGVAKDTGADELTRAGTLLGTPAYMAPEQLHGRAEVDARADLWAVGAVAYRALYGAPPFGRGSVEELAARILWSDPQPVVDAPSLPVAVQAWLNRALSKSASARFQSAAEMREALESIELSADFELPSQPMATDGGSAAAVNPGEATETGRLMTARALRGASAGTLGETVQRSEQQDEDASSLQLSVGTQSSRPTLRGWRILLLVAVAVGTWFVWFGMRWEVEPDVASAPGAQVQTSMELPAASALPTSATRESVDPLRPAAPPLSSTSAQSAVPEAIQEKAVPQDRAVKSAKPTRREVKRRPRPKERARQSWLDPDEF